MYDGMIVAMTVVLRTVMAVLLIYSGLLSNYDGMIVGSSISNYVCK